MASGTALATWLVARDLNPGITGVNVKAGGGEVGGWFLSNTTGSFVYLKLYDKSTPPTAADTPLITIPIPPNSAANVMAAAGINYLLGLGYRVTTGQADNDVGAPGANVFTLNLLYR